jgi:hypothetical protein
MNLFHQRPQHVPGRVAVAASRVGLAALAQMAPFDRGHLASQARQYYEEAFVLTVLLAGTCLTTTFLPLS